MDTTQPSSCLALTKQLPAKSRHTRVIKAHLQRELSESLRPTWAEIVLQGALLPNTESQLCTHLYLRLTGTAKTAANTKHGAAQVTRQARAARMNTKLTHNLPQVLGHSHSEQG